MFENTTEQTATPGVQRSSFVQPKFGLFERNAILFVVGILISLFKAASSFTVM